MPDKAKKFSAKEVKRVGSLLRSARDAIGASREGAASWMGAHMRTVQNWEEATSPTTLRLALYMRELATRSDLSREYVLQILGLRPEGDIETDEELQRKLALVRAAHGIESRTVRSIFNSLEDALEEFAAEGSGKA